MLMKRYEGEEAENEDWEQGVRKRPTWVSPVFEVEPTPL